MLYNEKITKKSKYRDNYLSSILDYLTDNNKNLKKQRIKYINPQIMELNQEKYRDDFKNIVGFPLNTPRKAAKLIEKTFVNKTDGISIYRMVFECIGGIEFYGILFEQDDKENVPFVIGLHGGAGTPETVSSIYDSSNYNDMVKRVIERGVTVFCPQLLLWHKEDFGGEAFDRNLIDGKLKQMGGSITALETYLISSCIDYFEGNAYIKGKIGVVGMSYGGMYSLALAATDIRIQSCLSSSFFNDRFDYSWCDWSYLNALKYFTDVEVCSLICPRALCISLGDHDEMFKIDSINELFSEVLEYYKYCDKSNNLLCYTFSGVHEFDKDDKGINFFIKALGI